jgi:hypothetical protein
MVNMGSSNSVCGVRKLGSDLEGAPGCCALQFSGMGKPGTFPPHVHRIRLACIAEELRGPECYQKQEYVLASRPGTVF